METTRFRSGWVTFAGIVAAIIAIWNILSGIAAIAGDDQTDALNEVLYGVSITAWGWFWLITGVIQLIIGSLAVFMIFVAPIWALVVLAIDLTVIWALLAGTDEFDTA